MEVNTVPVSQDPPQSRAAAKRLLEKGSNRFHLAIGFMICVCASATAYVLFDFIESLITGFMLPDLNNAVLVCIDLLLIILSMTVSLPLYHGYMIMCADTVKSGDANLMSLFVPLSSWSCFLTSFFLELMSSLSCLAPLLAIALGLLFNDTWLIHMAAVLFIPLWVFIMSPVRRLCRIHACFPSLSFRDCVRLSRGTDKAVRHSYTGLFFSYIPAMLLSFVTLFIYGVYAGFALKNLAGLDFTLKNICKSSEKKEY